MTTIYAAPPPIPEVAPKKKRGLMWSLRSALFGQSNKGDKKTKTPLPSAPTGKFSTLVGSVRPLHVVDLGQSPEHSGVPLSSASNYSSANNILELLELLEVKGEKKTNTGSGDYETFYDGIQGDEMIDTKADGFIAKFYQQVRVGTLPSGSPVRG